MSVVKEYSFPSAAGFTDIFVRSIAPEGEACGIIQIIHGMAEHCDRYIDVANYLADKGFAVFMSDHPGHGRSVSSKEDLGWFGEENGEKSLVSDAKSVTGIAKKEFPGKKVILWGHSMGSFVCRSYIAQYGKEIDAAIICGTAGANPAAAMGIKIAEIIGKLKGPRYHSPFINNLAFGSYNKKFDGDTGFEWLSVNKENVDAYCKDELCGYLFTNYAYRDMFRLLVSVSGSDWYSKVPSSLHMYLIAGQDDTVGNYGKGVTEVFDKLRASGHNNVNIKLWKGMRHEIHNETGKEAVWADIEKYARGIVE